jgi:hypothetical protein
VLQGQQVQVQSRWLPAALRTLRLQLPTVPLSAETNQTSRLRQGLVSSRLCATEWHLLEVGQPEPKVVKRELDGAARLDFAEKLPQWSVLKAHMAIGQMFWTLAIVHLELAFPVAM